MPTISYPDAGLRYDFSAIELDIKGTKFVGCSEISYSDDMEPGEVYGTAPNSLGATRGQYKAEGALSVFKLELENLLDLLADENGEGYGETQFTATVQYSEPGGAVITDQLFGCRIKKLDDSHSAGSDPLSTKVDLRIGYIVRNGRVMARKMKR